MFDRISYEHLLKCHEYNQKKRCPNCDSLNTKKKGYIFSERTTNRGKIKVKTQRFYCKDCQISFTNFGYNKRTHFAPKFKDKVVTDYISTKSSLSEVAKRHGICKNSILNWIPQRANLYQDNVLHSNIDETTIYIDGKEIKINGKRKVVLVASSKLLDKPIYYKIYDREHSSSSEDFLNRLKKMYDNKIIGIVSDFGRGKCFVKPVNQLFEDVPHQICLVHYLRSVNINVPKTKKSKFFRRNIFFKNLIKSILNAETLQEAENNLSSLNHYEKFFRLKIHKRFIKSINRNFGLLTAHFHYDFLDKTTNKIENINRQLNRKLKNLDGFKSEKNMNHFLKIWFNNYSKGVEIRPN